MDQNSPLLKKIELITQGKIKINPEMKMPYPLERSTTGPGSDNLSITLGFQGIRVKMGVTTNDNAPLTLIYHHREFHIEKNNEPFLPNVSILPVQFHAPEQAFINIEDRCIYHCAFCMRQPRGFLQGYTPKKFVSYLMKAFQHTKIDAFALTGGVYPDNTEMVNKYIQIIQGIRKKIPEIPIGVETIILEKDELIALRESGMDEMKINLQIPDEILFEKICPDFDYNHIISMLEFAVKIFGKGNVFSNIIFGLGESDDCVISAVENIAKIGVVPTLRKIRIGKKNGDKLLHVLPATIPEINTSRILKLAYEHKRILQKYHLTTTNVHTMCHRCGCCDIVPFQDL